MDSVGEVRPSGLELAAGSRTRHRGVAYGDVHHPGGRVAGRIPGEDRVEDERHGNPNGEAIAATQQVGDDLPRSVRYGLNDNDNMDDPSAAGGVDADQPGVMNTAAGLSQGGTGAGIEPGVDADLAAGPADADAFVADVYGDPDADVDAMTDPLGMGQDESSDYIEADGTFDTATGKRRDPPTER